MKEPIMTISNCKIAYNYWLSRVRDGDKYMGNENIPSTEREKNLKSFENMLHTLNSLLYKIGVYNQNEIIGGFKGFKYYNGQRVDKSKGIELE